MLLIFASSGSFVILLSLFEPYPSQTIITTKYCLQMTIFVILPLLNFESLSPTVTALRSIASFRFNTNTF